MASDFFSVQFPRRLGLVLALNRWRLLILSFSLVCVRACFGRRAFSILECYLRTIPRGLWVFLIIITIMVQNQWLEDAFPSSDGLVYL